MSDFKIVNSPEELAQSMAETEQATQQSIEPQTIDQNEPSQEVAQEVTQEVQTPEVQNSAIQEDVVQSENQQDSEVGNDNNYYVQQEYTEDQSSDFDESKIESAIVSYLRDKTGLEINSLDEIINNRGPEIDPRLEAIANFVQETGRDPQDWFRYQSLNTSDMDDMTAVKVHLASQNPNLSNDEVNLLISREYKFDAEKFGEEEVAYSKLKLKLDADKARKSIDEIKEAFKAPAYEQDYIPQRVVNDDWIRQMSYEVDNLEGVEFDLGNGKTFTYGLHDRYKENLKKNNANIENYFDAYVKPDGSWDFDLLSSHRVVIDNIDAILKSAYQQGLGDGQRNIVNKAANISPSSPTQTSTPNSNDGGMSQAIEALLGKETLSFKL
jgi:hypothetical protein